MVFINFNKTLKVEECRTIEIIKSNNTLNLTLLLVKYIFDNSEPTIEEDEEWDLV